MLYFDLIDKKSNCNSIYANNEIVREPNLHNINDRLVTWNYNPKFKDLSNIEYCYLISNGKTLDQSCPEPLKEKWNKIKLKHSAFEKSFQEGRVVIGDNCFYDLLPESFLIDFFSIKCEIFKFIYENDTRPVYYDFLVELSKFVDDIGSRGLIVDTSSITEFSALVHRRNFLQKLEKQSNKINYNIFGTATGRLTTRKNSFPILTLDKKFRNILKPNNDVFIELDFNAAELRSMLALLGHEQPKQDIHMWHRDLYARIYKDQSITREEVKEKFISWLYGSRSQSLGVPSIEKMYDKEKLKEKYWNGYSVKTPFGRIIPADDHHALNVLVQSFSSDIFLRQAIKVSKLLEGLQSHIAWSIHDSLVIDFSMKDKNIFKKMVDIFSETEYGRYLTNVKVGKHFGTDAMKAVSV